MNWIEPAEIQVPSELIEAVGGHPLISKALYQRGIDTIEKCEAFLDPAEYVPTPPKELPDLEKAVFRLYEAIRNKEKICVWGDFDVDGQTSTALLVETLQDLNANVAYYIPIRATESHGIKLNSLKRVLSEGAQVILTCDTGIAEHESIDYAQSNGATVIITDHHSLPPNLPNAFAVINPQRLYADHPLYTLPGVGVAYKLAEALYQHARRPTEAFKLLDLVALGIVSDVAVQTKDTRYLLQRGLAVLRTTDRLGLQALMELASLNPRNLTEEHIGFTIGPRLNALGRLSDANVAVEFFTTRNPVRARVIANQLEGLNNQRKLETSQVFKAAQAQIARDYSLLDHAVLVLSNPHWPAGIIGIVASRLAEHYNRPTILIACPENSLGRGSARSIPGCNITEAIATHQDLLAGFGGHPMAAGLVIDPVKIPEFRQAISKTVTHMLTGLQQTDAIYLDGYITLEEITHQLAIDLERLAPFGPGNKSITLAVRNLTLRSFREIGRNGEHLALVVENEEGISQKVLWWQGVGWQLPENPFDLACQIRSSSYQGQPDIQVEWIDFRLVETQSGTGIKYPTDVEVVDLRHIESPVNALSNLNIGEQTRIWCEGRVDPRLIAPQDRFALTPGEELIVWTTPSDPTVFHEVVKKVGPTKIILIAENPEFDTISAYLARLIGLLKFVIHQRGGHVRHSELICQMASNDTDLNTALELLKASGIFVLKRDDDDIFARQGTGIKLLNYREIETTFKLQLQETNSYRKFFKQAVDPNNLIPELD